MHLGHSIDRERRQGGDGAHGNLLRAVPLRSSLQSLHVHMAFLHLCSR